MSVELAMSSLEEAVTRLVERRFAHRAAAEWDQADQYRRALERIRVGEYRVVLEDSKGGAAWHWEAQRGA